MHSSSQKVPVRKALLLIAISLAATAFIFFAGRGYFRYMLKQKSTDARYDIRVIAQRCGSGEPLNSQFLAEMLHLSQDKPLSMYRISNKLLEQRLKRYAVIKDAAVTLLEPGVVVVEYSLKEPLAMLADDENIALDENGSCFPVIPYMAPRNVPEIILGKACLLEEQYIDTSSGRQRTMKGEHTDLAFSVMRYIHRRYVDRGLAITFIDVRKAFSDSADREVVIGMRGGVHFLVRVHGGTWQEGIDRFFMLYPVYIEQALAKQAEVQHARTQDSHNKQPNIVLWALKQQVVVDLRLQKLAYVSKIGIYEEPK